MWFNSCNQKLVASCSIMVFLFLAVGGVTARGQPSAAQGSVVHVSVPGAGHSCTLSAFKPHPAARQEWLLHHHHPTDRFLLLLFLLLTSFLQDCIFISTTLFFLPLVKVSFAFCWHLLSMHLVAVQTVFSRVCLLRL